MNRYEQILTKYWGYPKFRPLQEEIIRSVVDAKKDSLALLPTGGGKSIIFQVAALATEGICLVITPLIALMKDQVENLQKQGIKAAAIFSGMRKREIDIVLDNCVYGAYKFLYISPERLETELFKARVQNMKVNLIAVDEAHCISQWGYDFRPAYLKIARLRDLLPQVQVLALTATATPIVVDDIQEKLAFRQKNVFQQSFERKNLVYVVRTVEDKSNYLLKILTKVSGSSVVYVRNRKKTRDIAYFLYQKGISADYFHAGLKNEQKDAKQQAWKQGKTRVIVSTNAFGMGIDKANVRTVIHLDLPDSLEAYFQEAGRAGRDGKTAYAVLLYSNSDKVKLNQRIANTFPEISFIHKVYNALGNFFQLSVGGGKGQSFDFKIAEFAARFKMPILLIYSSLKFIQQEAYIEFSENLFIRSKIQFLVKRDDLYKFQVANANFDYFIKLLLRSYTGVFSTYAAIDEAFLAKKANTKIDIIYGCLQALAKAKIISYIPQRKTPIIIYTEERLPENSLPISKKNYADRKKRYTERINAVIDYASSTNKCRSQILINYFGQEVSRCGRCDVCGRRNELNLSKYEFDLILDQLKEMLRQQPHTLDELVAQINCNQTKILNVVRWLQDNHKIKNLQAGKMVWHDR